MALGFTAKVAGRVALVLDDVVNRWLQALVAASSTTGYKSDQFVSDTVISTINQCRR